MRCALSSREGYGSSLLLCVSFCEQTAASSASASATAEATSFSHWRSSLDASILAFSNFRFISFPAKVRRAFAASAFALALAAAELVEETLERDDEHEALDRVLNEAALSDMLRRCCFGCTELVRSAVLAASVVSLDLRYLVTLDAVVLLCCPSDSLDNSPPRSRLCRLRSVVSRFNVEEKWKTKKYKKIYN